MDSEHPIDELVDTASRKRRPRFTIANVLWATVACSLLLAALRTEMRPYLFVLGLCMAALSTVAGAMLAAECGEEAFRDGFCMAMAFYLALLCAWWSRAWSATACDSHPGGSRAARVG